jgi:hypothetical protein
MWNRTPQLAQLANAHASPQDVQVYPSGSATD